MSRRTFTFRFVTAVTLLITGASHAGWDHANAVRDGLSRVAAGQDPIPGPRTCFWARGPFGADPYINVAYPDAATFYWSAVFTIPQGAGLSLEGKFPHARYMSFISYDEAGRPIESVADYLIKPNPGSINPFLPDADRTASARDYKLDVVDSVPPPDQPVGMNLVGTTRDRLHTPKYGSSPGQQYIIYRIYADDRGLDETGGGRAACAGSDACGRQDTAGRRGLSGAPNSPTAAASPSGCGGTDGQVS